MSIQELRRNGTKRTAPSRRIRSGGLSIAVVGCGYWGEKHVRVVSSLPEVAEVVAVDPDPRIREVLARTFPKVTAVAEITGVLDSVDAVIVATPPQNHTDIGLRVLRAGKPVLIEKPLATSLEASRKLVAEAAANDVILMVGHTFLFNPAVCELRRRIDNGELGEIRHIHSARLNLGLYRSDVDVVWDLAPHDISIMSFLLRSTPTAVTAWGSSPGASDISDLAHFQLEYKDRAVMGFGHVSWLDPRKVRQLTVVGSEKMAVYDDLAEEKLRIFDCGVDNAQGSADKKIPLKAKPVSYRHGDIVSPHIDFQEPLMVEDRHFIECVQSGAAPACDGANGLAVVAALEAIDRSISTGNRVQIEPPQMAAVQTLLTA